MSLSDAQKAQARMYLGWERGYDLNSKLEDKLLHLDASEETLVGAVLTRLIALDVAIDGFVTGAAARVRRVDEIEFSDSDPFKQFKEQGRSLVARLSALLGVSINRDYYGDGGGPIAMPIPLG